jgi:hypothetical protein
MKSSLAILVVTSVCATFVACRDFTPIDRLASDNDAGTSDVVADVAAGSRCLSCARGDDAGGGCSTTYAACQAIPECQKTIACVAAECLAPGTDIASCLAACEADAGTSTPGAASTAFGALLQCMVVKCQVSCV